MAVAPVTSQRAGFQYTGHTNGWELSAELHCDFKLVQNESTQVRNTKNISAVKKTFRPHVTPAGPDIRLYWRKRKTEKKEYKRNTVWCCVTSGTWAPVKLIGDVCRWSASEGNVQNVQVGCRYSCGATLPQQAWRSCGGASGLVPSTRGSSSSGCKLQWNDLWDLFWHLHHSPTQHNTAQKNELEGKKNLYFGHEVHSWLVTAKSLRLRWEDKTVEKPKQRQKMMFKPMDYLMFNLQSLRYERGFRARIRENYYRTEIFAYVFISGLVSKLTFCE